MGTHSGIRYAEIEVTVPTINEHLANLLQQGEIAASATIRKFRIVRPEGAREVAREVEHYNLDAIIAVGFRVNSARAIRFRQWAAGVLRDYAIRCYVLDKERLKNGAFFGKEAETRAEHIDPALKAAGWGRD